MDTVATTSHSTDSTISLVLRLWRLGRLDRFMRDDEGAQAACMVTGVSGQTSSVNACCSGS